MLRHTQINFLWRRILRIFLKPIRRREICAGMPIRKYASCHGSALKCKQQLLQPTGVYITPNRASRRAILELQLHLHRKFYISTGGALLLL